MVDAARGTRSRRRRAQRARSPVRYMRAPGSRANGSGDEALGGQLRAARGSRARRRRRRCRARPATPTGTGSRRRVEHVELRVRDRAADRDRLRRAVARRAVDDQIVVSVGPYMLRDRAAHEPGELARERGRAAPRRRASAGARAASARARLVVHREQHRAIDGVHCRCVTPWRAICAAMREVVLGGAAAAAFGAAPHLGRAASRLASTALGRDAEVDQAGDLVDADAASARSTIATAASRACRRARSSRSSARRRCSRSASISSVGEAVEVELIGVASRPRGFLNAGNGPGVLLDQARRRCAGSPSSARARSRAPPRRSSPTKVCSISVTVPVAGSWPASRQRLAVDRDLLRRPPRRVWPSRWVSTLAPDARRPRAKVSGLPAVVTQTGSSGCTGRGSVRTCDGLAVAVRRTSTASPRQSRRTVLDAARTSRCLRVGEVLGAQHEVVRLPAGRRTTMPTRPFERLSTTAHSSAMRAGMVQRQHAAAGADRRRASVTAATAAPVTAGFG